MLITETVNYGRNKFYDTGPRGLYYKTLRIQIYEKWTNFVVSQLLSYCQSQVQLFGQTLQLVMESIDYESMTFLQYTHQVPISPTFYEQLLRQNPFAKKLQTLIVCTVQRTLYDCQFHQYFTSNFFIPKFFVHLLCAYNLSS